MSPIAPIAPTTVAIAPVSNPLATLPGVSGTSFATMLGDGLKSVEAKVAKADEMVRRFALDDSVPVHQVTYALEEARLSVEMGLQVRARLVEGYRELMNMQL